MPLYDFKCPNGHVTETIVSLRDRPEVIRCHCGEDARRQFPNSNWQINHDGPKESHISRAIRNVKRAEAEGRLD